MKTRIIPIFILTLILAGPSALFGADDGLPPPDGEKVWQYISTDNPYTDWDHWPGHSGMYPGKSPHGAYLKLYANPIAINAANEGKPMPAGAILVKENYGKDKKSLMAVTPMYKVEGFNSDAGDWFWAKYGPDGKVMASGTPKGCIQCHQVKKSNDWIFTPTTSE